MINSILPEDSTSATLVARIWQVNDDMALSGPSLVTVKDAHLYDLTPFIPTCAELIACLGRLEIIKEALNREPLYSLETVLANSIAEPDSALPYFLSPVDLQCIKAAGVTFADSLIERIIEERAGGDFSRAKSIREELKQDIGTDLSSIKPGSVEAKQAEKHLRERGLWSQYLEVGIGPLFRRLRPIHRHQSRIRVEQSGTGSCPGR